MNQIFGKMNLFVSVPVEAKSEEMGLLEANYRYEPNRIVAYEMVAVDCNGVRHKVDVHECESIDLNEFVEV